MVLVFNPLGNILGDSPWIVKGGQEVFYFVLVKITDEYDIDVFDIRALRDNQDIITYMAFCMQEWAFLRCTGLS